MNGRKKEIGEMESAWDEGKRKQQVRQRKS